jgi:hypothetical protein
MLLPSLRRRELRKTFRYELITPAGDVFSFPPRSPLRGLIDRARAHADVAIVAVTVLGLIWLGGLCAEALDAIAPAGCTS